MTQIDERKHSHTHTDSLLKTMDHAFTVFSQNNADVMISTVRPGTQKQKTLIKFTCTHVCAAAYHSSQYDV